MIKIPRFQELKQSRLTEKAHAALSYVIYEGDYAIDATVGNGHDTLFLAQCVGNNGRVIGFDIQEQAIESTRKKLEAAGMIERVELKLVSHENLLDNVPEEWKDATRAVVFNLGYLPGAKENLNIKTHSVSTLKALNDALQLICIDGIISIILYPGHNEGQEELQAVNEWIKPLQASDHYVIHHENPQTSAMRNLSPQWIWIQRKQ